MSIGSLMISEVTALPGLLNERRRLDLKAGGSLIVSGLTERSGVVAEFELSISDPVGWSVTVKGIDADPTSARYALIASIRRLLVFEEDGSLVHRYDAEGLIRSSAIEAATFVVRELDVGEPGLPEVEHRESLTSRSRPTRSARCYERSCG